MSKINVNTISSLDDSSSVTVGDIAKKSYLTSISVAASDFSKTGGNTVQNLSGMTPTIDGTIYHCVSWYNGFASTTRGPCGGGTFVWNATLAKSKHNGGTIISPTVPAYNGTSQTLAGFLNGTGETATGTNGCWVRVMPTEEIWVEWFGADPTGSIISTVAIQGAIDYAIYNKNNSGSQGRHASVRLGGGIFTIDDVVHLGYGVGGFTSVSLIGSGYAYRGSTAFNGTSIVTTRKDRPAFNFQGGRGSRLKAMSIIGLNTTQIQSNNMGVYGGALNDDTVASNWVDPTITTSRYAPYAAVTVDAYSGTRPGTSYPDVSYPSFFGAVSQYGKSFSSDCRLEDVQISGWVVGLANQPSNADGNGDYTKLIGCQIEMVQYGVSIGNSQSRNVSVDNLVAGQYYCLFTNRQHGKQIGEFGGDIKNVSCGAGIKIFDVATAYGGSLTVTNLYCESQYSLGTISATSSNDQSVHFVNCLMSYTGQDATRGVPAYILDGGGSLCDIKFTGGAQGDYISVWTTNHQACTFDGTMMKPLTRDVSILAEYYGVAHNATCGGVVIDQLGYGVGFHVPRNQKIKFKRYNLDTLAQGGTTFAQDGYKFSDRTTCIPIYVAFAQAKSESYGDNVKTPRAVWAVAKTSLASVTLTNKTLTFTYTGQPDWAFNTRGFDVGDVIYDDQSGSVFFVQSRTGTAVTAILQNNYKSNGAGGFNQVTAFSTTSGNLWSANCRIYTPQYYLRGDTTSGSGSITNCARDDGYAAWYNGDIAVNDHMVVMDTMDRITGPNTAQITARDHTAGTITISGTAARSETRRRLALFVRQPPANSVL